MDWTLWRPCTPCRGWPFLRQSQVGGEAEAKAGVQEEKIDKWQHSVPSLPWGVHHSIKATWVWLHQVMCNGAKRITLQNKHQGCSYKGILNFKYLSRFWKPFLLPDMEVLAELVTKAPLRVAVVEANLAEPRDIEVRGSMLFLLTPTCTPLSLSCSCSCYCSSIAMVISRLHWSKSYYTYGWKLLRAK